MRRSPLLLGLFCALLTAASTAAVADERIIFNSMPSPLPPNVASEGPEAYSYAEIGDAIVFPQGTGGTLTTVTVVMSSWACASGTWFTAGSCVTPKGATFSQPITMNIYAVDNTDPTKPKAGAFLTTVTQTFDIPYRPSSDTGHCPGVSPNLGQQWYNLKDGQCYHGLAKAITFDFSDKKKSLPSQILVGVAFNSTHYGPSPLGESKACFHTVQGCPYDSLNVSTDGDVFFGAGATTGGSPTASSVVDPNGLFFNYTTTITGQCGPSDTVTPGVLADDTVPNNGEPKTETCFTGYHPELIIRAKCGADDQPLCPAVIGGQVKSDDDDHHDDR